MCHKWLRRPIDTTQIDEILIIVSARSGGRDFGWNRFLFEWAGLGRGKFRGVIVARGRAWCTHHDS